MPTFICPFWTSFCNQRSRALGRGIGWEFDFHEWRALWVASGKWEQRGRGAGKYCMARNGDRGPYSAGNVRIVTHNENAREARINSPVPSDVLRAARLGKGRGWTFSANGYQAQLAGKYLGRYKTAAEAEAVYRAAVAQAGS